MATINLTQELRRRPRSDRTRELGLDDVLLVDRLASQHTLKAEARDVDRLRTTSDDLGDRAAGGLARVRVRVRARVRVRVGVRS